MQPDIFTKEFDFKAAADGTVEGLCSVFHNIDAYGEIVDDGAFDDDLPRFLTEGFVGGLNHDWDHPIGKPMEAKKQQAGLWVKGRLSDTDHGRECRQLMKDNVVQKLSIGYKRMGRMDLENADACLAYWEGKGYTPNADDMARAMHGAMVLTRVKLYEFSPVTMPANDLAAITAVKTEDIENIQTLRELEDFLRDVGRFSKKQARLFLAHLKTLRWDAESDSQAGDETPDASQPSEPPIPASETESKADETPVEPPASTLVIGLPDSLTREISDAELPLALKAQRQRIAATLYQQYLNMGAK